jgi:phosphoserine phosphatase
MLCTYAFAPGAEETVRALARFPMALISSNIDAYVEDVAKTLGIAHAYSYAAIEYSGGRFSGIGFRSEKSELGAKVEALEDFAAKAGIEVQDIAFVGDSRNDLDAFTATGRGILIGEGNEDLRRAAWRRVSTLSEIPEIL